MDQRVSMLRTTPAQIRGSVAVDAQRRLPLALASIDRREGRSVQDSRLPGEQSQCGVHRLFICDIQICMGEGRGKPAPRVVSQHPNQAAAKLTLRAHDGKGPVHEPAPSAASTQVAIPCSSSRFASLRAASRVP